ncbi:MAG: hypothetical protein HYT07_01820 [Candidatus Levybacteria bacterium]|nr:hypothetical protein [Candidatus Levybacteria bacterium]
MNREGEGSLAQSQESNLYLPARFLEGRGMERGALPLMLAQIVKELDTLPLVRSPDDLPEEIRYLRNSKDGILIMVSRRRPTSIGFSGITEREHIYGYFAEAYEEVKGIPQHKINNPSRVWSGAYERVDISDKGDYRDAGLTPTNFIETRRRSLGLSIESDLALSGGARQFQLTEGEETEVIEQHSISETGALVVPEKQVIAKLFGVANEQAEKMKHMGREIKDLIRGHFAPTNQGISTEVGLNHLVVTSGEEKSSSFIDLSNKLGLVPHTIPFWKMASDLGPYIRNIIRRGGKASEAFPLDKIENIEFYNSDSIRLFREQHGTYPLVVTFDMRSLGRTVHKRDMSDARNHLLGNISEEGIKHPLFAIIEISDNSEDMPTVVIRQGAGRYLLKSENIEDMQGLLVKIGVDYALTKQVRGLSALVSAL